MSTIHSISSLANSYADKKLAHQDLTDIQRTLFRKRIIFDFAVTGFNASTVVSVITVALAILFTSHLIFILALLACGVRQAFKNEVDLTALPAANRAFVQNHMIERVANFTPEARRNEIAAHLEINDPNWNPVQLQLLNFRAWMNWTSSARAQDAAAVQLEQVQQQG